jgi:hypothetical protein
MPPAPPVTTLTTWLSGSNDGWKKTYCYKSTRKKNPNTSSQTARSLVQTNLGGQPISHKQGQPFGHPQDTKYDTVFRIASQNIYNIPANSRSKKSYQITAQALGGDSADLRMWQEIGFCWPRLHKSDNWWYARTQGKAAGFVLSTGL